MTDPNIVLDDDLEFIPSSRLPHGLSHDIVPVVIRIQKAHLVGYHDVVPDCCIGDNHTMGTNRHIIPESDTP